MGTALKMVLSVSVENKIHVSSEGIVRMCLPICTE